MAYRLTHKNDPACRLTLSHDAWAGLLDLAQAYGWNPYGARLSGTGWSALDLDESGGYFPGPAPEPLVLGEDDLRLVVIDDALNLAEALERAYHEYEPLRLPADYFYFETGDLHLRRRPAIGTLHKTWQFCRLGAFYIQAA